MELGKDTGLHRIAADSEADGDGHSGCLLPLHVLVKRRAEEDALGAVEAEAAYAAMARAAGIDMAPVQVMRACSGVS